MAKQYNILYDPARLQQVFKIAKPRHKNKRRVILDHRNRELRYLWPDENATEAIRQLRKQGKRPARIITKEK